MSADFDSVIGQWAAEQQPSDARLREIMIASRKEPELDADWWKAQFAVMRMALQASRFRPTATG